MSPVCSNCLNKLPKVLDFVSVSDTGPQFLLPCTRRIWRKQLGSHSRWRSLSTFGVPREETLSLEELVGAVIFNLMMSLYRSVRRLCLAGRVPWLPVQHELYLSPRSAHLSPAGCHPTFSHSFPLFLSSTLLGSPCVASNLFMSLDFTLLVPHFFHT